MTENEIVEQFSKVRDQRLTTGEDQEEKSVAFNLGKAWKANKQASKRLSLPNTKASI